jgi:hypothetical protein
MNSPAVLTQAQASHLMGRAAGAIVRKAGGSAELQQHAQRAARAVAPKLAKLAAGKVRKIVGFKMGGRVHAPKRAKRAKK